MTSHNFIDKFHNLEGITIGEKNKSLQNLLKSTAPLQPEVLDDVIEKLKPITYLEETFKVQLLLFYKRFDDLLTNLISGEEILASKVIRQDWFLNRLIVQFTPSQYIELIPKLSVSIRTKLFKRTLTFVKQEHIIQELYEKICAKYGFYVAKVFLPGCSSDKIREVLEKNTIHLSASQLKLLFDKDKGLILMYFEHLKRNDDLVDNYKWGSFFEYMSVKDPNFYFEIADKFKIYKRKLGRQSTKKLLEAQKSIIFEKPEEYIHLLRQDALVRKLGADFPEFFKKSLPQRLSDFRFNYAKSLLQYYPKHRQYALYFNTFQEKYDKNLWENLEFMSEKLIEFVIDEEEKYRWISKFENRKNINKYRNKLKLRKKCAMFFVEDETTKAVKDRKTTFNTLISTCKLTRDYDAFLNILISFCERHRNSDVTILYNFLRTVHKELDMDKLTEDHWKYIREIINIQLFKKQQIFFPIFLDYIKFLYLRKNPIKDLVYSLLNEIPQNLSKFVYDNDEFHRTMLEMYVDMLPHINDKGNVLGIQVALSVMNWNLKKPTNAISISEKPIFLDCIKKLRNEKKLDVNAMKVLKFLICRQNGKKKLSELDEMYWSNIKKWNNITITWWFLKYKPNVLADNLDKIGIILNNKNINLIRSLKKYDHLSIPKTIETLCIEELKTAGPSERKRVVEIMVYFMSSEDLLLYLKQNIPHSDKVDINSDDKMVQKNYEIQCALVKNLKSSVSLRNFIPVLLKYCRGDILSSALSSLYSSFCRIPEEKLYSALEDLSTKAISVRKHTIFLSALILPTEKILQKYEQVQISEQTNSVKHHMFMSCYKYFLKNQVRECWVFIENYLKQLKKKDRNTLKMLTEVNRIPEDYRTIFIEYAWFTLEKFKKQNVRIDDNMIAFLRNLRKRDIKNLRSEFGQHIIEEYLFNLGDCSMEDSVLEFVQIFSFCGENCEEKVSLLFKVIHNFKKTFWDDQEKKIKILKMLNKICLGLLEQTLKEDEDIDQIVPKLFHDLWNEEFLVEETFEEHLMVNLILCNAESRITSDSLPKQIYEFFSDSIKQYGNLIISSFKNFLSSILPLVLKGDDYDLELLKFIDSFLRENCSPDHYALVIELLPQGFMKGESEEALKTLINVLMQQDRIVKIRLFEKLKSGYY